MKRRLSPEKLIEYVHKLVGNNLPMEDATARYAGLMSAEDKRKLDSIEEGANRSYDIKELEKILLAVNARVAEFSSNAAPVGHDHDKRYPTKEAVARAVERKVDRDDFLSMFNQLLDRRDDIRAAKLGGKVLNDFVLKEDLTYTALRDLFATFKKPLGDAATLEGKALRDLQKMFQPRTDAVVSEHKPASFKAGHRMEAASGGVMSAGKVFTPDPLKSNLWKYRNGGPHIFRAPIATGDYEIKVIISNDARCGLIAFDGFTSVFGDNIDGFAELHPVEGEVYLIKITRIMPHLIAEVVRVNKSAPLLMGG